MSLLQIPVRALHLSFEAREPVVPPQAVGAMWRGVLGRVLRNRDPALYRLYFEPKAPAGIAARYDDLPGPFAIEAPPPHELAAMPGEALDVWLKVFGAIDATPLVDAFAEAAWTGLGKGRGKAELTHYAAMWESEAEGDPLDHPPAIPPVPMMPVATRVMLTSPLRLKVGGSLLAARTFDPQSWLRALVRRLELLAAIYGTGAPPDKVGQIEATMREPQLWQVSMHRWSARQKREIDMSGPMGSFLLPLDGLEAVWPLLWLGQWTQVGSGTNAGLGAYRLKPV